MAEDKKDIKISFCGYNKNTIEKGLIPIFGHQTFLNKK